MQKIFYPQVLLSVAVILIMSSPVFSQVTITIDAAAETHPVSPFLYGRNNSLSDSPSAPLSAGDWLRLKDSGVMFLRESGGNNSTKYNWKKKIGSHPDWYNNVYAHDWDFAAQSLQTNLPRASGMWAFQLIGKVASNTGNNFSDWTWNTSQWWRGVNQNLAGGGTPNPSTWAAVTDPGNAPSTTSKPGNANQYLQNWPADSTVAILDHWFNDLSLNKSKFSYWNMDNEVEIWNGTHDDIMPVQIGAEDFMQKYFEVAKKARAKFPEIKITGPVVANEWQWYNWAQDITSGGKTYPWLEYFIKRVAEEEAASGVKLLDVLDIHFYPGTNKAEEIVQLHRVFFDKTFVFPEANGVKHVNGGWDNTQNKEYILQRCLDWLKQYKGENHGVTLGVTEIGVNHLNASTTAVWYASTLGEFMRHPEMEIFTPWTWNPGMWEVLHLFARYHHPDYIRSASSDEVLVSAYPTISADGDSLTVTVVNRATTGTKTVKLNIKGFNLAALPFAKLTLSNLPATETFNSHTNNALAKSTATKTGNAIDLTVPAMSITTVQLSGMRGDVVTGVGSRESGDDVLTIFPNPVVTDGNLRFQILKPGTAAVSLLDAQGKNIATAFHGKVSATPFTKQLNVTGFAPGLYTVQLILDGRTVTRKVLIR